VKLGAAGAALIKSRELLRLRAYKPTPVDKWTIGWGHTGPEVVEGLTWVLSQAEAAFAKDTGWAATAVMKHVDTELTQNQFDALVAFVFNVGEPNFASSTLLKCLNRRDYAGAAGQFALWNHQDGKVLAGLTVRREQERVLFTTPQG
jgi:lysozyme